MTAPTRAETPPAWVSAANIVGHLVAVDDPAVRAEMAKPLREYLEQVGASQAATAR